ncbi:hypothetical protein [Desertivirga brevis]|uniref:hypothetical protein n=1 Tax=Desertivirga brevis TaxID=2810310 RepID=UPI001A96F614|nr:hypothetical protein [Pedobacter sp. SYSU D00873]
MKDVSDNEFDRLIKEKSQNFDYEFEEEAWLLMEKKLRRKDRTIFLRNFSIAACTLLLFAAGLYMYQGKQGAIISRKTGGPDSVSLPPRSNEVIKDQVTPATMEKSAGADPAMQREIPSQVIVAKSKSHKSIIAGKPYLKQEETFDRNSGTLNRSSRNTHASFDSLPLPYLDLLAVSLEKAIPDAKLPPPTIVDNITAGSGSSKLTRHPLGKPELSFTFSAGPDFSSTRAIAGKRADLNVGLLINVNWRSFTVSTGARYGVKKYDAEALDYALRNPSRASEIYNIDASCNVLEIPVQLSVPISYWKNKNIAVIGGLSSYLMLKEKYLFEYTPESGVNDFILTKTNANQSYFGVAGLSARYTFKPTNQNIRFGLEPYVKLPLGGVGEGKVKLKSSGISLTMTYGTTKKH